MERYCILIGHLVKQYRWMLETFVIEIEADNKSDVKKKMKQRFKSTKDDKYVLLEIKGMYDFKY